MRYFTDGAHGVIRVHTDASLDSADEFRSAAAEIYQFRKQAWAARPNLISSITFTGDWNPCTEEEAAAVIRSGASLLNSDD